MRCVSIVSTPFDQEGDALADLNVVERQRQRRGAHVTASGLGTRKRDVS